ncbi:MAG: sulfite exporter TauE/SafE family protein [Proteobacteria bacterium]|nr:sulfite exporter TauE/SafE family protein [Pseudomonadota bacterium]
MPSPLVFAAIAVSVVITSFISGILGMAGGMILMGILLAFMPVPAAMMLHGVAQMAANGWRAWLWRGEVNWRVFRGFVVGALGVLSVFSLVQLAVSKPIAYLLLGTTPFIGSLLPRNFKLNVDKPWHPLICGVTCIAIQLLAGISGPLLDVFFVHSQMDRKQVVATKAIGQAFGHILKIFYFGVLLSTTQGVIEWWLACACVALAVFGTTLSRRVLEAMTDANFRAWTRRTVMATGLCYLGTGLYLLC